MALIGIDLGTTNSAVAVWTDAGPRLIAHAIGENLTPSVVGLDDDNAVLVGQPARNRLVTHPERTVASFKRWMGTTRETRLGRGHVFRPEELSAFVLKSLKADAESNLSAEVREAVISVPAFSTTSSARRRSMPPDLPASRSNGWSTSRPPPHSPTACKPARKDYSSCSTSAAAPSMCRFSTVSRV